MEEEDTPDISKADKDTKQHFKNLLCEIQEIDSWMETLEYIVTAAWQKILFRDKRSATEEWWSRCRF